MRLPPRKAWNLLEANEDSWYRRWCHEFALGEARVFLNPRFAGDPVFSHVTSIRARPASWRQLLGRAEALFTAHKMTPFVFVSPLTRPRDLGARLAKEGYALYDQMCVRAATTMSPTPARDIVVERAEPSAGSAWQAVFASAFQLPSRWIQEVRLRVQTLLHDASTQLYFAHLRSTPAGVLALHLTGQVAGIYCLGTLARFRRQGVGGALLQRAARDAVQAGADYVCLQHLLGDGVGEFYDSVGFRQVFTRSVFVRNTIRLRRKAAD